MKSPRLSALLLLFASCTGDPGAIDKRMIPGALAYPESLGIAADGTLYVGSLATGAIARFAPGEDYPEDFHAAGADDVKGVAGVLVDDASVWICSVDVSFATPAVVRSFDRATGALTATYPFPSFAFCNDLAFGAGHELYVTDSVGGTIYRLPAGGTALEPWISDPRFIPGMNEFALDGIAVEGSSAIYVNKFNTGELFRITVAADGSAGAITALSAKPALEAPDGMRLLDQGRLLVVEGAGRLTELTITGTVAAGRVLDNRLDGPTSVVVHGRDAWVTEGQLRYLLGAPGSPSLPFLVRRIVL